MRCWFNNIRFVAYLPYAPLLQLNSPYGSENERSNLTKWLLQIFSQLWFCVIETLRKDLLGWRKDAEHHPIQNSVRPQVWVCSWAEFKDFLRLGLWHPDSHTDTMKKKVRGLFQQNTRNIILSSAIIMCSFNELMRGERASSPVILPVIGSVSPQITHPHCRTEHLNKCLRLPSQYTVVSMELRMRLVQPKVGSTKKSLYLNMTYYKGILDILVFVSDRHCSFSDESKASVPNNYSLISWVQKRIQLIQPELPNIKSRWGKS